MTWWIILLVAIAASFAAAFLFMLPFAYAWGAVFGSAAVASDKTNEQRS